MRDERAPACKDDRVPLQVYVDESQRSRYLLAAVTVDSRALSSCRSALRDMLLPGQRRIHLAQENIRRRRELTDRVARLEIAAAIYTCKAAEPVARPRCLEALVKALDPGTTRLVIESRAHEDHLDRKVLADLQGKGVFPLRATYEHLRPHEEPLLWIADALAWAWGAGGDYRRRIGAVVGATLSIAPGRAKPGRPPSGGLPGSLP